MMPAQAGARSDPELPRRVRADRVAPVGTHEPAERVGPVATPEAARFHRTRGPNHGGPLDFPERTSQEPIIEAPIAYLQFGGDCREALTFYAEVLGGQVLMMSKYSDAPPGLDMPPVPEHWIMHGRVGWPGGGMLMGSDGGMEPFTGVKGVSLSCNCADVAAGEKVFAALSAGGTIRMPFQSMFWSPGFGLLTDRFGVPWMVNVDAPMPAA